MDGQKIWLSVDGEVATAESGFTQGKHRHGLLVYRSARHTSGNGSPSITLRRLAADDRISVSTVYVPIPSPPSPLTPAIMGPLERLVADQFPGVPIVPVMEAGATDGLFLRNAGIATYGVSAVFEDPSDIRAHGRDERIGVQSFYDAVEFWHRMLRALAS